jgi:hypothetical protein
MALAQVYFLTAIPKMLYRFCNIILGLQQSFLTFQRRVSFYLGVRAPVHVLYAE